MLLGTKFSVALFPWPAQLLYSQGMSAGVAVWDIGMSWGKTGWRRRWCVGQRGNGGCSRCPATDLGTRRRLDLEEQEERCGSAFSLLVAPGGGDAWLSRECPLEIESGINQGVWGGRLEGEICEIRRGWEQGR